MNSEEITALRSLFREEVKNVVTTNEQHLREIVREEVNAAVYSSEQRMRDYVRDYVTEALKGSEQRLREYVQDAIAPLRADIASLKADVATLKGDVAKLKENVASIDDSITLLTVLQRTLERDLAELQVDYSQAVMVLDEATVKINEIQASQRALEIKFDEGAARLREDVHKMVSQVAKDFLNFSSMTAQHLEMHEKRPADQAHPRTFPHSA